jgi:hypothetical protein
MKNNQEIRKEIIRQFAYWTVVSALRSGSKIKSREKIIRLLKVINLGELLKVTSQEQYDSWHTIQTKNIVNKSEKILSYGWAAKIVNVYLKTLVYISSDFYQNVKPFLHPPVDGILLRSLIKEGKNITRMPLFKIEEEEYFKLINEMKIIMEKEGLCLLEIEKYWRYYE